MGHLASTPISPDALTFAGVSICALASVVVYFEYRNEILCFWVGAALFVIGSVLNRAARLQAHAPDDGVIVDLATRLQLQDHFPLQAIEPIAAKGFARPVPAWIVGPADTVEA